jgi:hypothetical protein
VTTLVRVRIENNRATALIISTLRKNAFVVTTNVEVRVHGPLTTANGTITAYFGHLHTVTAKLSFLIKRWALLSAGMTQSRRRS